MISKIEAVVLRSIDYSETSQIVSVFSRELGRVSVIARGSRRPKSKYGSTLQPMSHIQAVVYNKDDQKLLPLSESSHSKVRRNLSRDLTKISIGLRVVELIRGMTQERDPNGELFDLLISTLDLLDAKHDRVDNILLLFQMRFAFLLGIEPDIVKEDVEELDADGYLSLETGAISSHDSHNGRRASRSALRTFAILARANSESICAMQLTEKVQREVSVLIDQYFQFHFDSAYPTRGSKILRRLRDISDRET